MHLIIKYSRIIVAFLGVLVFYFLKKNYNASATEMRREWALQ